MISMRMKTIDGYFFVQSSFPVFEDYFFFADVEIDAIFQEQK